MRRLLLALLVALLLLLGIQIAVSAAPPLPPSPTAWVTDTAGLLSPDTRQTLNARLQAYERAAGHQVLVWIGKTTGETPLEDWAARTFAAWRVGREGLDDGLVLFLLADDRAARIEVGYGLEEKVPDAVASRILRDDVIPKIKAGDPDGAVTTAVDRLITAVNARGVPAAAVTTAPPAAGLSLPERIILGAFVMIVLVLVIRYPSQAFHLLLFVLSQSSRRGGNGSGGFGGGIFRGGGGRSGGGGASGRW